MARIIRLAAVIAAQIAVLAVLAAPVPASFPGRNGDIVAWSSTAHGGALHRWLLFLTPRGTERRRVAVPSGVGTFNASPDGRRLAYDRVINGREFIMVADLRLQHQRRVTTSYGGDAAWSPDGRYLAFVDRGIWVVGTDGHERRRLTTGRGDTRPVWLGNGRTIVFNRDVHLPHGSPCASRSDLYSASVAGSPARRLFRPPTRCGEVGVADRSPSGRRLLVIISDASLQSAPADPRAAAITGVGVLNSDGSRLRRILPAGNGGVLWSPDGRRIAFSGAQCPPATPSAMSVCLANTDGRGIHQIASVRDGRGLGAGATMWLVRRG